MTRIVFNEVRLKATKRWTDASGKKRQKTETFCQTINPFNRNAAGQVKSRDEIMAELKAQRDAWLKQSHEVSA